MKKVMENGEVATRPLRNAKATDNITLSGEEQEWEPSFTFHGFRFVQVEGWPEETELNADSVTAIVVNTDMERTGFFNCSNPLLNKLHENIIWSMRGNFLSVPTDCPQRDERLAVALRLFGTAALHLDMDEAGLVDEGDPGLTEGRAGKTEAFGGGVEDAVGPD